MAKYRVLSMDGGGVRGVLTARLLSRIGRERPAFLSKVELFAGTSTGSILAIGLAKGLTPDQIVGLYQSHSATIFHEGIFHNIGHLWGLAGAKYSTDNRYNGIHPSIGDVKLKDLPKKALVATFQLDSQNPIGNSQTVPRSWKAKFFHNYPGADSDGDQKAIDVIMRSSAAPTYFPIYQGFIDGGVVANNPSMCALAQAINPGTGNQNLRDVVLLSIGTGLKSQYLTAKDNDWGLQQWGLTLIDLIFDAGSGLADYQCLQLLGDCYHRLNPDLHDSIGLDAVNQIDHLIQIADRQNIDELLSWLDRQWLPDS